MSLYLHYQFRNLFFGEMAQKKHINETTLLAVETKKKAPL
jgi:hypothetical protein